MKKINLLQIVLITFFVFLIGNIVNAASFNDVPASHINSDAIEYVKTNGIVEGYPNGDFKPDSTINRAEFTKIIVGAKFDSATIDSCISKNIQQSWTYVFFPDVPKDAWFAKYICVAKINNIVAGYPDGNFKPANDINFAEASKIIVNTFGYTVGTDSVWYKPFVDKLGESKAIPTTITDFNKNITRGEMAEIIYRLKANVTTKESLTYQTIQNPTLSWKMFNYINSEYQYQVEAKYPSDWKLENNGATSETPLTNPPTYFVIFDFTPPTSLNAREPHIEIGISKDTGDLSDLSLAIKSKENVQINNETYELWHTNADNGTDVVYIFKNGNRYEIKAVGLMDNPQITPVFRQMFNVLKVGFVDNTVNWKTYQSDKFKFQVKTPADWQVNNEKPDYFSFSSEDGANGVACGIFKESVAEPTLTAWYTAYYNAEKTAAGDGPFTLPAPEKFTSNTVNGITAIEANSVFAFDRSITEIYMLQNGNVFTCMYPDNDPNDSNFADHFELYKKVTASFKFTK